MACERQLGRDVDDEVALAGLDHARRRSRSLMLAEVRPRASAIRRGVKPRLTSLR